MCEYTCDIFLPSGDPLLCQLFPMMLNSHWNIVSGENCFIRKTTLAHSFNSVTLPLSPLISYSYRLYRSPVSPSVPASVPSWITFALFCLWFIFFFSCTCSLHFACHSVCFKDLCFFCLTWSWALSHGWGQIERSSWFYLAVRMQYTQWCTCYHLY